MTERHNQRDCLAPALHHTKLVKMEKKTDVMIITLSPTLTAGTVNSRLETKQGSCSIVRVGPAMDEPETRWFKILESFVQCNPKSVLLDDGFPDDVLKTLSVICSATGRRYGLLMEQPKYASNVTRFA